MELPISSEFHPIANIFPLLPKEEISRLADDIKSHGLRNPGRMFEGKLLDGRNRKLACDKAGVKFPTKEFTGSKAEALAFVWSENFCRRHLNPGQAAIAEAKRAKLSAEYAAVLGEMKQEAKERQADGGRKAGRGRPQQVPQQIGEAIPEDRHSQDAKL